MYENIMLMNCYDDRDVTIITHTHTPLSVIIKTTVHGNIIVHTHTQQKAQGAVQLYSDLCPCSVRLLQPQFIGKLLD